MIWSFFALAADPTPSDVATPRLQSRFDGAELSVIFDEPVAQELSFAVTGVGTLAAIECTDPWSSAWFSTEAECGSRASGALEVAGRAWVCLRLEVKPEGTQAECVVKTTTGDWRMRWTVAVP